MSSSLARRVRGELRKVANPVVGAGIVLAAAYSAFAQLRAKANLCAPAPTPLDWAGSVRIALDQHVTLIGFALAGIAAGCMTAEEAADGALAHAFLVSSSTARIWAARILGVLGVLVVSSGITAIAVRATAHWIVWPTGCAFTPRSTAAGMLGDAGTALGILVLAATVATVIALVARSALVTVLATVAVLVVPSMIMTMPYAWVSPATWVVESAHLTDYGGGGIDYVLGLQSAHGARGSAAAVATAVIWAVVALLTWLGIRCLAPRGGAPGPIRRINARVKRTSMIDQDASNCGA